MVWVLKDFCVVLLVVVCDYWVWCGLFLLCNWVLVLVLVCVDGLLVVGFVGVIWLLVLFIVIVCSLVVKCLCICMIFFRYLCFSWFFFVFDSRCLVIWKNFDFFFLRWWWILKLSCFVVVIYFGWCLLCIDSFLSSLLIWWCLWRVWCDVLRLLFFIRRCM